MFTGIVQAKSTVTALTTHPFGVRLTVSREPLTLTATPALGDSICVSGVCLTVAQVTDTTFEFDVIAQTLSLTTLGRLAVGDPINLEPAVTPQQPLGGHFMQGHVDGIATVTEVHSSDDQWRTTFKPAAGLMDYIIPQGSIAVDGVSLTLAQVTDETFTVALIPTTLEQTTLGNRKVGDVVNLEADILSKTVVHALRRQTGKCESSVTMELLGDAGFLADS